MSRTAKLRTVLLCALIVTSASVTTTPASATITRNRDGSSWASGSFKTYVSDGGSVDSTISYWVHYWPNSSAGTAKVDYIFLHESPPRRDHKIWIRNCIAASCASTYQFLAADRWRWVTLNWRVKLGSRATMKVTNSWDPTGIWGETWTGTITLR